MRQRVSFKVDKLNSWGLSKEKRDKELYKGTKIITRIKIEISFNAQRNNSKANKSHSGKHAVNVASYNTINT